MRAAKWIRPAIPLVTSLCLLTPSAPAHAALRNPQVVVHGTGLQSYFDSESQLINVLTDQVDAHLLEIASPSFPTYMFECELKDAGLELGIYDGHSLSPAMAPILPPSSGPGWFVVVTFQKNPDRAHVVVFDAESHIFSNVTYPGLSSSGIGLYVRGPGGTLFSQDDRNPAGAAQALVYASTAPFFGDWWIAFESSPAPGSDGDFDDVLVFTQQPTGVPVRATTWEQLKARFH